jgi:hypothetical protein
MYHTHDPKTLESFAHVYGFDSKFPNPTKFHKLLAYKIISHKTTWICNNFSRNSLCYFGDLPQVQFPTSSWCKQVSHLMLYPFGRGVLLAKNFDPRWDYQWSTLLHHQWLLWLHHTSNLGFHSWLPRNNALTRWPSPICNNHPLFVTTYGENPLFLFVGLPFIST